MQKGRFRADMAVVAPYTRAIRTYAVTGGLELVPPVAAEFGLKVTLGAWIDTDAKSCPSRALALFPVAPIHPPLANSARHPWRASVNMA